MPLARPSLPVSLAILALATGLLRLGSLFPEQIDWDEWSFILMGADVARGHLPFIHLFDLKPPMIFFLCGGTIALFGKSLLAIRLLGTACVFIAAMFVLLLARRLTRPWCALAGTLIFAALASTPLGSATGSELPATAFLCAAVWSLSRPSARRGALAGFLIALAVLTRTNLAIAALVLGGLLLAAALLRHVPHRVWLAYAGAGMIPPLLLAGVYAASGELATLKLAMIDVPLAYAGQQGMLEVASAHVSQLYYTAQAAPLVYAPVALLAALGAPLAALRHHAQDRWPLVLVAVSTVAVTSSLLVGGAAYPHYWLQLLPFVGLGTALALTHLDPARRWPGLIGATAAALPVTIVLLASVSNAAATYASPRPIARAATHIAAQGPRPCVWALHKHLIHWYLDAPQLSRAGVHPDNLARRAIIDTLAAHGYVGPDEVARLMALQPQYVVTDAQGKGLAWVRADGKPVDAWLSRFYRLDARFEDVLVYRRKKR